VAQLGVEQFGFEVGEAFVEGIDLLSVGNELQPGLVHAIADQLLSAGR
jgi:hypothetical protein